MSIYEAAMKQGKLIRQTHRDNEKKKALKRWDKLKQQMGEVQREAIEHRHEYDTCVEEFIKRVRE